MNIPSWPAIGTLKVTLAGCHGPILPGFLTPFSDFDCLSVIPNLFTGPENPLPFVSPRRSISWPLLSTSRTEISLLIFSLIKLSFSSLVPASPISRRSGFFFNPVILPNVKNYRNAVKKYYKELGEMLEEVSSKKT